MKLAATIATTWSLSGFGQLLKKVGLPVDSHSGLSARLVSAASAIKNTLAFTGAG
jgi:hypothetical protein